MKGAQFKLGHLDLLAGGLARGLLAESVVEVWCNSALGEGDVAEELGELVVVADSEGDGAWGDALLLVLGGDLSADLEELGGEVLEDGGQVDWGGGADALGVAALLEHGADSADWEDEADLLADAVGLLHTGGFLTGDLLGCHYGKFEKMNRK